MHLGALAHALSGRPSRSRKAQLMPASKPQSLQGRLGYNTEELLRSCTTQLFESVEQEPRAEMPLKERRQCGFCLRT